MPTLFTTASQKRHFRLLPLWALVWFVILISALKLASGHYYERNNELFARYDRNMVSWLFGAEFKDDLKIIMLGNSRLRNAFLKGLKQPDRLSLPDGRSAAILQFNYDASVFNDYRAITDAIIKQKPDLLVIQAGVITNTHAAIPYITRISGNLVLYAHILMQDMSSDEAWFFRRTHVIETCFDNFATRRVAAHVALLKQRDRHIIGPENESYMQAQDFVSRLIKQGTSVIVMQIESNKKLLDMAGHNTLDVDFNGLDSYPAPADILPESYDKVRWLSYKAPQNNNIYCDIVHLNEKGRVLFEKWLLPRLSATIK